jgi:acetyl-CoA acetyltransferase
MANGSMLGGHSKAHPGFGAVQNKIAKEQGISQERAGSILAASSRNASKAAHKANPRLNRVKG